MKKKIKILTLSLLLSLFTYSQQCNYFDIIKGKHNTEAYVSIKPTSIIVNSSNCKYGFNFDIEFDYDVLVTRNNDTVQNYIFYTLQGTILTNKGNLFFNLNNESGSGFNKTTGNAWSGDGFNNCSEISLDDIIILDIIIQIQSVDLNVSGNSDTLICNNPMPVELLFFNSYTKNQKIYLNWSTETETNNDYFKLEKSYNGNEWIEIGHIKGHGNNQSRLNYEFIDILPKYGPNYYKLSQIDFNGNKSQMGVVHEDFKANKNLNIYPNPTVDFINITGTESSKDVMIFTSNMKRVYNIEIIDVDDSLIKIDCGNLENGIYFISLDNELRRVLKK